MIETLYLENLKCFSALRLDLRPLTLLTGFNAAGKSTSLQSLLLLAQTLGGPRGSTELMLNGPLVTLGSPADVLSRHTGSKQLTLGIGTSDADLSWRFGLNEENRRTLMFRGLEQRGESGAASVLEASECNGLLPESPDPATLRLVRAVERTVFLGAARQVDTEVFPIPLHLNGQPGDVGVIGQYAPWWLYSEGDSPITAKRLHPDSAGAASTLRQQVNLWCGDLFPGAEVNSATVPRTSLMRLELRSGPTDDWSSPANIGYGISYAFPILVAGLLCEGDSRPLVLDSPEAHLHPRGQSRIGAFLAQMAAAGSRILVETHSDHLLNGVRLAIREGRIAPQDVSVYFFSAQAESRVTRLSFDRNGSVSDWPEGFFDQSEKDLAALAGWI